MNGHEIAAGKGTHINMCIILIQNQFQNFSSILQLEEYNQLNQESTVLTYKVHCVLCSCVCSGLQGDSSHYSGIIM